MKTFSYIAQTAVGVTSSGSIDAQDERDARQQLQSHGLTVNSLELSSKDAKGKTRGFLPRFLEKLQGVSLTEKALFTHNLYIMTKSGIPLAQSLSILREQTKNKRFQSVLQDCQTSLERGESFAKILSRYPKYFSEVYVNMISAGEASGKLETILEQLARQLKKERTLIAKVRGAMTYPIIVVTAMVGIGVAMMIFVIPKITDIYKESGASLPLPTQILIRMSDFLTKNGLLSAGIFIALLFFLRFLFRTPRGKSAMHALFLRVPIGGTIIKKIHLARFSRTLQSLLKTDIPIVQSFQIIEHTLSNVHYQRSIHEAAEALKKGITIVESLRKWPKLFPPMVTQMIAIGEESGRLDELTDEIANFYEEDVDETMNSFSSIIEPVLLLILGLAVGAMAVAILLPMYSLTEQI
ncbi:MAG: type II secretion system F family protein [bacterium]